MNADPTGSEATSLELSTVYLVRPPVNNLRKFYLEADTPPNKLALSNMEESKIFHIICPF